MAPLADAVFGIVLTGQLLVLATALLVGVYAGLVFLFGRLLDPATTVEGFSGRLRDHVDLDTLATELLGVVDHTVQPTQASLWLRRR